MRKSIFAALICLAMVSTAMPVATGPVQFGHTWGTEFSEYAYAVDVDSSGNVYLSGTILGPEIQAFVAKVNIYGIKMWDTLLSSPTTSLYLYDSALGPSNSLYVVGQYSATDFYDVGTFYAKIDSSGSLVYQKYLPDLDTPNRICANTAGNGFIIVGDTGYYGTGAVVAVKDDGSVNWAQSAESPEGESPWAAVTDSSGAVYTFLDSCIDSNVAIAKFSKTGRLVKQSVLLTDSESEYTWDIGIGHDGNIYALGANYGNGSLLLASFTPKLDLIWDEYVGTPVSGYEATRLVIASDGSLWAVGFSTWTNGPAVFHISTSGAVLEATLYEFDMFFGTFSMFDAAQYPYGGIVVAGRSYGFPKATPVSISGVEVIDIPNAWTADSTQWSKLTLTPVPGDMVSEDIEGTMDNYDTSQSEQAWYGVIDPPPPAFKSSITVKTTQNPYELSFKASASGGKSPYSYEWYFGDGFKASGQQVRHEYAMGGLYQVLLVVTDAKGLVSWATADVSLPAYPVITHVTHYPDPAFVGETVSFEISAYDPDGGSLSYLWTFGDGSSMTTSEPFANHSYDAQGVYDFSVTVTDDEGLSVGTLFPVTIIQAPQSLGWSPLTIPSGHYINLVGIETPFGNGIHVDSIGSSDYGYQMMGLNETTHTASATGEIQVSGYFRQYDDLMYYDQPGRRLVRIYVLDPYNGTVLASADALNYSYLVNTWYHRDVILGGLAPYSPVNIGIGRPDMWQIDWNLVAEWAGVSITPVETNESTIVAEAGPIQYLWGQNTVTLNGSGSYSDAGIVSYVWTWVAGNGTNKSVTGMMPTFPAEWFFSYGNYTITLTVTDSTGNTATDTVNIHFGFRIDYNTPAGAEQCYASSDGYFRLRIENHGMTSFDWTIYDFNLNEPPYDVYNATVIFAGDGIYLSDPFWMSAGGHIQSEYVPNGPVGSYFIVYSYFVPASTQPPSPPVLTNPANGATGVLLTSTLTWTAPEGSNYYEIEIFTPSNGWSATHHSNTSWIVFTLDPGITWSWHVRASSDGGLTYGGWSATWTFTTISEVAQPVASFTYSVEGATVYVDASGSSGYGGVVMYAWDWGDGTNGTGVLASHTYATSMTAPEMSQAPSGKGKVPPPHPIFGFTYAADGMSPIGGCNVTITNQRTGEYVETMSDVDLGAYIIDMSQFMLGWVFGDILNVTATYGSLVGWNEAPVTDSPGGYDQIDVTLSETGSYMTVMITLTITDTLGRTDTMTRFVSISTGSAGWQEPTLLQSMPDYQREASVGMDDHGNAIALWEQPFEANSTPENIGIWFAMYDHAFGWGMPEKIWNGTFEQGRTTLGVSPNGQAVAAWYPEPPPYDSALYLCLFDPATGWGIPEVVQEGNGYNYGAMGADVDDSGNAMVLLAGPTGQGITAWRHDNASGWQGEVIPSNGVAESPQVRFDASGCALVVWDDSQVNMVKSARYVPGSGWGPVVVVSGTIGGWGSEMAVDDSGRGLATFVRYNGTAADMYGNVFDPSTGWDTPTLIGPAAGGWHPHECSIAAAAPGEFFVVWEQRDRSAYGNNSVWSRTWNASTGWGEAIRLSDGFSYTDWMWPSIAANENGEVVVSWTEGNSTMQNVVAVRYTPGMGWGTIVTIDSSDIYSASLSRVAMAPNGDTVVIWGQSDGINDLLWGRVYLV